MAVKGILSTVQYKPFSYEEMLAPVLAAEQAHQAQEEVYSNLLSEASTWENNLSTDPNDPARKLYDSYINDLKAATNALATKGLSSGARKDLIALKGRYKSDIGAIEKADTEYKNMLKAREALLAKDPSIRFDKNYTGISDFLNGKVADNSHISLDRVASSTAAKAQNVAYSIYNRMLSEGSSPEEAILAIASGNAPELEQIMEDEIKANNIIDRSPEIMEQAVGAISSGIQSAANSIAQKEYISAKEREALRLQKNNYQLNLNQFRLSESRFKGDLAKNGFKEVTKNGISTIEIDEDSPIWKKDKDGNIIGKIGTSEKSTPSKDKLYSEFKKPQRLDINIGGDPSTFREADEEDLKDKGTLYTSSNISELPEEVHKDLSSRYPDLETFLKANNVYVRPYSKGVVTKSHHYAVIIEAKPGVNINSNSTSSSNNLEQVKVDPNA